MQNGDNGSQNIRQAFRSQFSTFVPSPRSLVIAREKEILPLASLCYRITFRAFRFELLQQWEAPIAASMTDKTEEGSSVLPVRFWGLNPLFWCHMKMFVKEVQSLEGYSDYKGTWCSIKV